MFLSLECCLWFPRREHHKQNYDVKDKSRSIPDEMVNLQKTAVKKRASNVNFPLPLERVVSIPVHVASLLYCVERWFKTSLNLLSLSLSPHLVDWPVLSHISLSILVALGIYHTSQHKRTTLTYAQCACRCKHQAFFGEHIRFGWHELTGTKKQQQLS